MNPISSKPAPLTFLIRVFLLEALSAPSVANLTQYGIFFYMQKRFGWGARQNLVLSSAQGMVYVVGRDRFHLPAQISTARNSSASSRSF